MKYRYVVAFQLIGVTKPSAELEGALLELSVNGTRGRLTANLNTMPSEVDQAAAVGGLLLRGFVGQGSEGTPEEHQAREVEELRDRRREKTCEAVFLIVESGGEIANNEHNFE